MRESQEVKYYEYLDELNKVVPGNDYRNCVIAKGLATGHRKTMNEDWLRKVLIGDHQEGFIDYNEMLNQFYLYKKYLKI